MDEATFPWCVVAITKKDWLFTAKIPECFVYKALEQGWQVVARDSDILTAIEPSQSNPRRREVDDDGA